MEKTIQRTVWTNDLLWEFLVGPSGQSSRWNFVSLLDKAAVEYEQVGELLERDVTLYGKPSAKPGSPLDGVLCRIQLSSYSLDPTDESKLGQFYLVNAEDHRAEPNALIDIRLYLADEAADELVQALARSKQFENEHFAAWVHAEVTLASEQHRENLLRFCEENPFEIRSFTAQQVLSVNASVRQDQVLF